MTTAKDRGWGDPFAPGWVSDNIRTADVGPFNVTAHRLIIPHLKVIIPHLHEHYPHLTSSGFFNKRPIRGYEDEWARTHDYRYLSNHSWGLAGDLDAPQNPMTTDPHARHEFTASVMDPILKPFRGRWIWGGEYKGQRKDYMHSEFIGTPHDAVTLTRQLKLGA